MRGYTVIGEGCVDNPKASRPVVSVIVPIYNVERYLDQALTSIENQTLPNIEILCINDGSTDASLRIIQNHAQHDERIRVIDKPNEGYGATCNCGIEEAHGLWIAIVEPDDYILPTMYEDMTRFADSFKEDVDIVKTPYYSIWEPDSDDERLYNCSYLPLIHPKHQPFTIAEPGFVPLLGDHPSIWSALYRRSFLNENDIRFPAYAGAGWADNPFMMEAYCKAKAIVYLPKAYYAYREDTPEKAAAFARNQTLLPLDRWQTMTDFLDEYNIDDPGVRQAHNRRGFMYLNNIAKEVDISNTDVHEATLALFNRMDDNLVFSDATIAPSWKKLYADIKGVDLPAVSTSAYLAALAKKGIISIVNEGPERTLKRIGNIFTSSKSS